jgi:two-component system, response regulator
MCNIIDMSDKVILLADDNPMHAECVRIAIDAVGIPCRLELVREGTDVIQYLFTPDWQTDARRELPALVLLNLRLPKMDGRQVLQVLRRVRGQDHTRLPPVVVISAFAQDHDVADSYRLGARSYACTPSDRDGFIAAITEILHYWLKVNQAIPAHHVSMEFLPEGL